MGHMVPYVPLVRSLQNKGHEVIFILRDLSRVDSFLRVRCLQAPTKTFAIANPIRVPCTYPHILHNMGWSDPQALMGLVKAWRALYDLLRPSLVIFDHSPTALLAARGYGFKKLLMGTGFCIPRDSYPLPNLRFRLKPESENLRLAEDRILQIANMVLARFSLPSIQRISDLLSKESQALFTYQELDPYDGRENGSYWGTWTSPVGIDPVWPEGSGKKVFAYLKPFPTLPALFTLLTKLNLRTIAYIPGVDQGTKEKFASPALRFADKPLNMDKVTKECDLAILNGTHYTTAQLLMAGKPTLHFPLYLEQMLTAHKVEQIGAGLSAPTLKPAEIEEKLNQLLHSGSFAEKAKAFSMRYENEDERILQGRLGTLVQKMINNGAAKPPMARVRYG